MTETSAPYTDPAAPPAAPPAACPEGSRITDFQLLREAPTGPAFPITEPYEPPEIRPAPTWVPDLDEELWDACQTGRCDVQIWDNGGEDGQRERQLLPPGDLGWQTRPDRGLFLDCYWYDPVTGGYLQFPGLEFCADLQWEEVPETPGQIGQPVTPPTIGVPTLEPPTSTLTARSCADGSAESGFLGSLIIATGVLCALQDAFVPNAATLQTTVLDPITSGTASSSVFAGLSLLPPLILGMMPPDQGACPGKIWSFPPEGYTPPGMSQLPSGWGLTIPCDPPWDHSVPMMAMNFMVFTSAIYGAYTMISRTVGGPGDSIGSAAGDAAAMRISW